MIENVPYFLHESTFYCKKKKTREQFKRQNGDISTRVAKIEDISRVNDELPLRKQTRYLVLLVELGGSLCTQRYIVKLDVL